MLLDFALTDDIDYIEYGQEMPTTDRRFQSSWSQ